MAISILIFILGAVCSYLMGRLCFRLTIGSWTANLRLFTIIISALMSWIGFAVFLFVWLVWLLSWKDDGPAKW